MDTVFLLALLTFTDYGKCPKFSYTICSDKVAYANSVDPDQIDQGLHFFAIPLGILRNNCIKSKI